MALNETFFFIKSVSNHVKCGIQSNVSTVGVHSCEVLVISVVAMETDSNKLIRNRKKLSFFVICVILKDIFPINTH